MLKSLISDAAVDCECRPDARGPGGACADNEGVALLESFVRSVKPDGPKRGDAKRTASPASPAPPASGLTAPFRQAPPAKDILPTGRSRTARIISEAAEVVGCNSETCVFAAPAVRAFAKVSKKEGVIFRQAERFAVVGPRESTSLLSDSNLDDTLRLWSRHEFKQFFPIKFAMTDFASTDSHLGAVDVGDIVTGREPVIIDVDRTRRQYQDVSVLRKCLTMACIINTDVSSGPGKHWVCLFIDCRPGSRDSAPWTVEFFNSTGNPPARPIVRWMEEARATLQNARAALHGSGAVMTVPVTLIRHQFKNTECGVYVLFYIRSRLEGRPFAVFTDGAPIRDEKMEAFRRRLFSRHRIPR